MSIRHFSTLTCALCVVGWTTGAHAYASAEILTNESYQYGRFEASIQFAPGSGVVGSFFLWKDGSEVEGTFWNELDFEAIDADCRLQTNAYYGNPAAIHSQDAGSMGGLCGAFHTYAYEWTPDYIAWLVDGAEIRRETGEAAAAYRDNTAEGMQLRFNIWPGDANFGGTFDPSLLPVYQRVDWVQYSSYDGGGFVVEWREEFTADAIPSDWTLGTWESPKGLSTHSIENAGVVDGVLVLALTADDALGIPGVTPPATGGQGGQGGTGGTAATGGSVPTGGVVDTGGSGGSAATGGIAATGGDIATGGIVTTGGTESGGASDTGGAINSGGSTTTGGSSPTGGAMTGGTAAGGVSTGGVIDPSTGGAISPVTGGAGTGTGGTASPTGGANPSGGTTAQGGQFGAGGSSATGGTGGPSGLAASTGTSTDVATGPTATSDTSTDDGCTCRAGGGRSDSGLPAALGAFGLLALGASLRRRSRR